MCVCVYTYICMYAYTYIWQESATSQFPSDLHYKFDLNNNIFCSVLEREKILFKSELVMKIRGSKV